MRASSLRTLRELAGDFLDIAFPRECVHCHGLVERGWLRHLCASCAPLLSIVREPHCTTCGHPFFGEMVDNRICPHCEALKPRFGTGKTAILLKGPGRSLVHALKYHRGLHILEDVVTIMSTAPGYVDYLRDAILVPVPLHPRKLREREFNQSFLLAACAAQASDNSARIEPILQRVVDTASQTRFDRETRHRNLKNAFALVPGARLNPTSRYVLFDDVFTTGSTLNSCAAVLRRSGLTSLDVVTFGHG